MSLIGICHGCEYVRLEGRRLVCSVTGRLALMHVKAGECPHDKFVGVTVRHTQTSPEPIKPVPRGQWPLPVRVVAKLAKDGEAGIGDTIQWMLATVGGDVFKALAEQIGMECGCSGRQATLNAKYPY